MPLFSVIIPSYNRADLVVRALDTVFAQQLRDFEVIVADDGSTDGTPEAVARFGDAVRFVRQSNQGPGAARNLGIQHATGEYLAFLDSDDLWFPWTLAQYAAIICDRKPAMIAGSLAYFTDEAELRAITQTPLNAETFPDYLVASRRGLYCGSCQLVVRRNLACSVGGFASQKMNSEDHDFVLRLGTASGFVYVHAPYLIGYRQHSQSLINDVSKAYRGGRHLVEMERSSRYPGGADRRGDRRRILSQHLRHISLHLLNHGSRTEAWHLYRETFLWNLTQGRVRFLLGFPLLAGLRRR